VAGPALMLGDNMSILLNTTVPPPSLLKKKWCAAAHHLQICKAIVVASAMEFCKIPSSKNCADLLTKPLPKGQLMKLVQPLLFCKPSTALLGPRLLLLKMQCENKKGWPCFVFLFFV